MDERWIYKNCQVGRNIGDIRGPLRAFSESIDNVSRFRGLQGPSRSNTPFSGLQGFSRSGRHPDDISLRDSEIRLK